MSALSLARKPLVCALPAGFPAPPRLALHPCLLQQLSFIITFFWRQVANQAFHLGAPSFIPAPLFFSFALAGPLLAPKARSPSAISLGELLLQQPQEEEEEPCPSV